MPPFSSLYGTRLDRELGSADSTVLFTTARRQGAINEGVQEFAVQTHCLTAASTVAVVHGQEGYILESSAVMSTLYQELAVNGPEYYYVDTNGNQTVLAGPDLKRVTPQWLDQHEPGWQAVGASDTGVRQDPRYFYLRVARGGEVLNLHPIPGRGSTNDLMSLKVYYHPRPDVLTSDTQIPYLSITAGDQVNPVAPVYHQAAVHWAAYQLEKLRRDTEASEFQLQKFLGYVSRYIQSVRVKSGTTLSYAKNYFRNRTEIVKDPRT